MTEERWDAMREEAKMDEDESAGVERERRVCNGDNAVGVVGAVFLRAADGERGQHTALMVADGG